MRYGSDKYVVRHGGRAVTKPTRRVHAFRVRDMLGDGYEVWNLYTRRVSLDKPTDVP